MKFCLINPNWSFDGSIYFGCREPHLPLEFGYAKAILEANGHDAEIVDGQLDGLTRPEIRARVTSYDPDAIVITTAPSYLLWRCGPPELRVPQEVLADLDDLRGLRVVVGPHASMTPAATLRRLKADVVILGEFDEVLAELAAPRDRWPEIPCIGYRTANECYVHGGRHVSDMEALPALRWPGTTVRRHHHHHHRFDSEPRAAGAEMETARGPYRRTFGAKETVRNEYRRRPLATVLKELDDLIGEGVEYVYFVDDIFLPNKELLEALIELPVQFGMQTRVDLWAPPMLDLLGAAGCVSFEAGVERLSIEGSHLRDKDSRLTTEQISDRLKHARQLIPFVQANLLDAQIDAADAVEDWRLHLIANGVWATTPVPLVPYPGSPDYATRWGRRDDQAWERAVDYSLASVEEPRDIQEPV